LTKNSKISNENREVMRIFHVSHLSGSRPLFIDIFLCSRPSQPPLNFGMVACLWEKWFYGGSSLFENDYVGYGYKGNP
jgi:hypothetical protein